MAATFTAPHPGLVTKLRTFGRTTNSTAGDPGDCTVRLINQTNIKQPVLEHEERTSFNFDKGPRRSWPHPPPRPRLPPPPVRCGPAPRQCPGTSD